MGSAREEFHKKADEYLQHFGACKGKPYESPEYQEHFQMAKALARFIIERFKAGELDGKDFFDTELKTDVLFSGIKDPFLREEGLDIEPEIKQAVKDYIAGK